MTNDETPQVIGLAGTFAAGKDTLAHELERTHGYGHVSTGDMLRTIASQEHGSTERDALRKTATTLREEMGAGALVLEALKAERPLIVSGLRSLGEAKEIKKAGGSLVFVDAPSEIRYQRMIERSRDDETQSSFEEFVANEEKEMYAGPKDTDFNIRGIGEMADVTIDSSRELDGFIKDAYKSLGLK